eukprot:315886-Hanusia_phi.AAC.1
MEGTVVDVPVSLQHHLQLVHTCTSGSLIRDQVLSLLRVHHIHSLGGLAGRCEEDVQLASWAGVLEAISPMNSEDRFLSHHNTSCPPSCHPRRVRVKGGRQDGDAVRAACNGHPLAWPKVRLALGVLQKDVDPVVADPGAIEVADVVLRCRARHHLSRHHDPVVHVLDVDSEVQEAVVVVEHDAIAVSRLDEEHARVVSSRLPLHPRPLGCAAGPMAEALGEGRFKGPPHLLVPTHLDRQAPLRVGNVEVSSLGDQEASSMHVPPLGRHVQRRHHLLPAALVDVCLGDNQRLAAPGVSVGGRQVQRGHPLLRDPPHVCLGVQHHLHTLQLPLLGAVMERDLPGAVRMVHVCAMHGEVDDDVDISSVRCLLQRSVVILVHSIHISPVLDQQGAEL